MKKKSIFVTFCLKNLIQPRVYKIKGWAEKRCIQNDLVRVEFSQETKAQQFFAQKKKQFKLSNLQIMNKLLQSHSQTKQYSQIPIQNQPQITPSNNVSNINLIDASNASQRQKRQRQINEIMERYTFFKQSKFKSICLQINSDQQYEGYFDGASKNNPGVSAIGYLIKNSEGKTLLKKGQFIGLNRTNNQSQLLALYLLMAQAYCNKIKKLKVYGDSLLTINYMNKLFQCRSQKLLNMLSGSMEVSQKIDKIQFHHINRSYNHQADEIANNALKNILKKKN